MKRVIVMFACAVVASLALSLNQVDARPQYKTGFGKIAKGTAIEEAAKKESCNVCHVKGEKKSVRNDFGKALAKAGMNKDFYTNNKADKEAFAEKIDEGLKKFLESKEGAEFKKAIDEGKLPAGG